MPNDTSRAGTIWISGTGKRYVERQRCGDEVQLCAEDAPGLACWFTAIEIERDTITEQDEGFS